MSIMTLQEALGTMKSAKTVQEWNLLRDIVKKQCPDALGIIDANGLIVKILKSNAHLLPKKSIKVSEEIIED